MFQSRSYRIAFGFAIALHVVVGISLFSENSTKNPVLELAADKQQTSPQAMESMPDVDPIKAVSVDNKEVEDTVKRLKMERQKERQAEENRQKMLTQQAEALQKKRIEEQQRIEKLKTEAEQLAIERKKQVEEEQKRLKQLAKEKQEEEKRLADMKKKQVELQKQQQEEAKKLAELKKKQEEESKKKAEELAKANKEKEEKARQQREALAKADAERKRQAAAAEAARDAEKKAQMAGEVDKYKAMIINSISRQWILPENVNSGLSSQFRIRLAPDGAVLEVTLTRSSGDSILDRSAQSAIYKASPLPVPSDPLVFDVFRDISLTVRPENARG